MFMKQSETHGIFLILFSSVFGALISLFGKLGSMEASVTSAVFMRFFLPTLIMLPGALQFKWHYFHWNQFRFLLLRAWLLFLCQICFFFYLSRGTLLNAMLLLSTGPLFMPILARIFMKQKLSKRVVFCLLVGFVGVACILKPTEGFLDWAALVGLLAGFLLGCTQLTLHKVTRLVSIAPQMCLVFAMAALFSLLFIWVMPEHFPHVIWTNTGLIGIFLALGFSSVCNQILRSLAYRHVDNPATLAPYLYMSLIFSGILQYFVFGLLPEFMTVVGAILIVAAALGSRSWRKRPPVGG